MNIKKYIRKESKSWIIAILLLFVMIYFGKSFEYLKSITDLNPLYSIGLVLLIIVFGFSFLFYSIWAYGLHHNEELEFREYEIEDVDRIKRKLKKSLTIFSLCSIIWILINSIVAIEYGSDENLKYLIFILIVPIIINGVMIYIFHEIKTAYNNAYN